MIGCVLNKTDILEGMLSKKMKVRFRTDRSSVWYTTVVDDVRQNEVTLAFPEVFAAVDVMLAEKLTCKFYDENFEYMFEGDIRNIKVTFPQQIKVRAAGEIESFEARRDRREETMFLANVITRDDQKALYSCVKDVSSSGIRIISKHFMKENSEVGIHMSLPVRNIFDSVVKFKGKVRWSRVSPDYNEYGIAITDINEADRSRMTQFLEMYSGH